MNQREKNYLKFGKIDRFSISPKERWLATEKLVKRLLNGKKESVGGRRGKEKKREEKRKDDDNNNSNKRASSSSSLRWNRKRFDCEE